MSQPRRKLRMSRVILIVVAVVVVLAAGGSALYLLFGNNEASLTYTLLPIDNTADYRAEGGVIAYATANTLVEYRADKNEAVESPLYQGIDGYDLSATLLAVYKDNIVQVRGQESIALSGDIRSISCGESHVAVLRANTNSGNESIAVLDADGTPVGNALDFSDSRVVNFGFYSDSGKELLWVIGISIAQSMPVTTIKMFDYTTGGSLSYFPAFYDQTIERLYFTEESIFIVGTQSIIRYSFSGSKEKYRVPIYGLEVIDMFCENGSASFLLRSRDELNAQTVHLLTVSEADAAADSMLSIHVPETLVGAFLQNNGVRCITSGHLYSYTSAGKSALDIETAYTALSAIKVTATQFMIETPEGCFLCSVKS